MKIENDYVVRRFKVPSRGEPGKHHIVELWSDDSLSCECIAAGMGRECRHQKIIRRKLVLDEQPTLE